MEAFDGNKIGIRKLNLNEPGHNRKEGERHCGRMALRSSDEGLTDDIDRDEYKYGRNDRTRNEFYNEADISEDTAQTNEETCQQCISRTASHLLVSGLTYIRCGLSDASANPRHQRRYRLGQ